MHEEDGKNDVETEADITYTQLARRKMPKFAKQVSHKNKTWTLTGSPRPHRRRPNYECSPDEPAAAAVAAAAAAASLWLLVHRTSFLLLWLARVVGLRVSITVVRSSQS